MTDNGNLNQRAIRLSVPPTGDVSPEGWRTMKEQAQMLVQTGFLPQSIKTPEQAVAIALKGRELGIPMMYALSNITVIQGKPTCNAELMLALIYRDQGDGAVRFTDTDDNACTIEYKRRSWDESLEYTFSMEMARKAGITGNQTWSKYPAAMLRARCISAVARMAFADSIGGMYTPEELGAAVTVEDGEVVLESVRDTVPVITISKLADHPEPKTQAPAAATGAPLTFELEEGEAWDRFAADVAGHLRKIGCAEPLVDDTMKELLDYFTGMGVLEDEAALNKGRDYILRFEKAGDVTKYRAAMQKKMQAAVEAAQADTEG